MKMVNTSLLAIAAGVLISPALMAANLDGPSVERTFGNEYLSTADATDTVSGDVLAIELGAEYAQFDEISLTFSGAALDDTTLPTSATLPPGSLGGGDGSGVVLGLVEQDSGLAVYRVTEITPCDNVTFPACVDTTVGVIVPIAAADVLTFGAQEVDAAGGVTVAFSATRFGGGNLDTGGGDDRTHDYLETDDQFSAEVDEAFDQVVDVNQQREGFEDMDCCDFAEVDLDDAPPAAGSAIFVDQDVVWAGDFSWMYDDDDTTDGIQLVDPDIVIIDGGCTDLAITVTEISYTCPFSGTSDLELDPSLNDAGDGLAILPATSYTVTVTANFTGFGGTEGSVSFVLDAGEWVLNGFQAELSYTPFGTGISQVIYIANRGSQAGDITVDYVDQDGNSETLGVVATLQPTSTLSLGNIIRNALPPNLRSFGRIALTITANVPACDAQVNAQYNVGGNSRAYTSARDNCDEWPGSF